MSEKVCFVIPVLNEMDTLPALLARLNEQFPSCSRVFVDGGSTDGTATRLRSCKESVVVSDRGRARQMNAGAKVANSDYLLFLHADTVPSFCEQDLFSSLAGNPKWGFCPVEFDTRQWVFRIIALSMNLRSRLSGIGTGDQLLWLRREVFESVGGFTDIPLMEDVALCKKLRQRVKPVVLPLKVKTSARRWRRGGVIRTILLMWCLRAMYFFGVSPARLYRWYYPDNPLSEGSGVQ